MARSEDLLAQVAASETITETETALYDRQIRLWGIEAQEKLRHSRVLIVGMKGLGAEIAKNLVLCGLKSMQIIDNELTTEEDTESNFFLCQEHVRKPRGECSAPGVQALNPLTRLECSTEDIDKVDLSSFSLVILADQPVATVERINEKCRSLQIRFMAGSVFGWLGYAFTDFNAHNFLIKKKQEKFDLVALEGAPGGAEAEKENAAAETTIEEDEYHTQSVEYPSFKAAFSADFSAKKLLRKIRLLIPSGYYAVKAFLEADKAGSLTGDEEKDIAVLESLWTAQLAAHNNQKAEEQTIRPEKFDYLLGPQLSATCGVVGGFVGQESIKALTNGKSPYRNIFIYSALNTEGRVCDFPPQI